MSARSGICHVLTTVVHCSKRLISVAWWGILLSPLPALAQSTQPAQPPFSCSNGKSYLFQNTPTDAYEIDLLAGTTTQKTTGGLLPGSSMLNAFGYNQKDGYIWGQVNGQRQLVRVGSDYSAQTFAFTAPNGFTETTFVVGDISGAGILYLTRGGSGAGGGTTTDIYAIDLTTAPYVATAMRSTGGTYLTDWAVSPVDGHLYALYSTIGTNNPAKLTLYRFLTTARTVNGVSTAAGTREILGTVAGGTTPITASNFGAVFMDSDGTFYVVANATGNVHRIERPDLLMAAPESTPISATFVTTGPAATTNNNDGARCALARVSSAPLPVTLTSFTATLGAPQTVALRWATATELQSDHFVVERSTDGETFTAVGTVPAAGSSTRPHTYTLQDASLPAGASRLYYRLRQVDHDGSATYSAVRTLARAAWTTTGLQLTPNPAPHATTRLSGAAPYSRVQVLDAVGRPILTGVTTAEGDAQLALPAGQPAGIYLVRVGQQVARLVVE